MVYHLHRIFGHIQHRIQGRATSIGSMIAIERWGMIQFMGLCMLSCPLFSSAQSSFGDISFQENKGQWPTQVKYRADMGGGAYVLLKQHGYGVVMYDTADMHRLWSIVHGGEYSSAASPLHRPRSRFPQALSSPAQPAFPITLHGVYYEVQFLNSQPTSFKTDHPSSTQYNYFIGNDPAHWASHVQGYGGITYERVYPHIDVRLYTEAGRLKSDWILYPGARVRDIQLQYEGVTKLEVKKGNLLLKTAIGTVTELEPFCYQYVRGQRQQIACKYILHDLQVGFQIMGTYDPQLPLIIDPVVVFATFTGSTADNWGFTATYDAQGNFYAGGIVFGDTGSYPVTPGAFQQTYGGGVSESGYYGYDMAIAKFDPLGRKLLYATYLGGSGNEQPHSLIVDHQGNLIIAGRTNSSDFPHDITYGPRGGYDIAVAKLSADGSRLIHGVVIGGSNNDGVNITFEKEAGTVSLMQNYGDDGRSEVIVDEQDNVYVASCTQSANFPVTPGVFQSRKGDNTAPHQGSNTIRTPNGPLSIPYSYFDQDAVILKFHPDLTLSWASYLGGSGNDAAYVIDLDLQGNIYVAGATSSSDLPAGRQSGAVLQPNYQGGDVDGFVAEISNDGSTLLRRTYLGTTGIDEVYGLALDRQGYPYVCGTTTGNWPVVNAQYVEPGGKQFIAKLKPDLSGYVYATTFGTNSANPNISPVAFLVDRCENVYVSGWGGALNTNLNYIHGGSTTAGMTLTPDALQKTTDGSDFYFFVLKRDASGLLYASYWGGAGILEHVDGGTSRFDPQGVIYEAVCGGCRGLSNEPVTPGVWSPFNRSSNCNEVALKIAFNLSGVHVGLKSVGGDTSGCVPFTVQIEDTAGLAKRYVWDFEDGSGEVVTTQGSQQHTYTRVGRYRVMVVGIDSSSCNVADTGYMWVKVGDNPARIGFLIEKVGPCTSWQYRFINTSVAMGGGAFTDSSFEWDFGDGSGIVRSGVDTLEHGYGSAGVYGVKLRLIDTNFCNAPVDSEKVLRVASNVRANFSVGKIGCAPYEAVFENRSEGGIGFEWDFGDGSSSNEVSPVHLYSKAGEYIVRLIASDSTTCNKADTMVDTIRVYGRPVSDFVVSPVPPQENVAEVFTNLSQGGVRWWWDFGDGSGDTTYNTSHLYSASGQYEACLRVANEWGCEDTSCRVVEALIHPMFDVPSAFSPNGDGVNDKFLVRGYGIGRFEIEIYNRWGQKVYESRDINQGWDGTYRGKPQPMDAYAYVIHIQFTDGRQTTKTGSVTLLR
ncbi:MAG: PKD domain-containing protein [Thermoflavifilum sp.]|nr:PKD domain-containing protein [Thermoflavifilum sp.]